MSLPIRRLRRTVYSSIAGAALVASVLGVTSSANGTAPAAAPAASTLSDQLHAILADPHLAGAQSALTVRDADTGQTLYDTNGSTRLLPASNAKLYTSAAALDILGPAFTFDTSVLTTGQRHGPVLGGDLYLKGYGDPMETAADYDELAAKVAASGIRVVLGSLVADDTYYDNTRLAPFWSWDDEPYYYSAQTSALNISPDDIGDTGTVLINVLPGARAGDVPRITTIPANHYVQLKVTARTGAPGSASTVDAVRAHGKNVIDVTGSIPVGAAAFASQPTVDEPTGLAADVFRSALARHGVRLPPRPTRFAATPAAAHTVAVHQSEPLTQLLTPFLKLSNNLIAETLTKAMGVKTAGLGNWDAGTAAILADAARNGVDTSTLRLHDGSGLGRADYLTSDQTTTLLLASRAKPWFAAWYEALPIAGVPGSLVGGTLRNRMAGTAAANNLHGKTGSMTGVSSLSGYLTDAEGHQLVFTMFSNNFISGGITTLENAVAVTLANYGGPNAAAVPTRPRSAAPTTVQPSAPTPGRNSDLECSWVHSC